MISRSLFSRKPHTPIIQSLLFRSRITQKSSFALASSCSTFSRKIPSASNSDSGNLYKLNHKDWLSPTEVLKIFSNLKDSVAVISVLEQYSKRKDYKPNEALYTLVINQLAQAKSFDAIEDIMKRIKNERMCRLSDGFFYNVIKIYGNMAGRIKRAIETLFDMPSYNCWPSVKTFNFVLNLLVSAKLFDEIHDIYTSAAKLGIEIDACCLNILVKGLCENGNLEAAFYVLDEFPKQNCQPNVRTFSTLMHGLCEQGKVEEAFGLLERMENEGIDADTITFNILISGLRKQRRVEEGLTLLEKMKAKGCYPNSGSYQEVLYGLLDKGRFMEAKELVGRMVSERMGPSFMSYKKLIHGLCNERSVEDVDWVLKQMVQQGFVPRMGMWREIIRCASSGHNSYNHVYITEVVDSLAR
ncbi:Pentatricopeptide repeat [Melia azedarach]|uniref:Pentatricopeptide repeat n=1 Tax=Melia azedarach TaxID=155640 RepID=A0ACC1YSQ3_MELAZ|nr:Pentatricopeptide repeat [Melia azedarach]